MAKHRIPTFSHSSAPGFWTRLDNFENIFVSFRSMFVTCLNIFVTCSEHYLYMFETLLAYFWAYLCYSRNMFGLILVDFLYFGWLFDVFVLSPTPPHPAPPKKGGVVWCGVVWCGVGCFWCFLYFFFWGGGILVNQSPRLLLLRLLLRSLRPLLRLLLLLLLRSLRPLPNSASSGACQNLGAFSTVKKLASFLRDPHPPHPFFKVS